MTDRKHYLMSAPLDCVSMDEAAALCVRWASVAGATHNVVTLNSKTIVTMSDNPALKESVLGASLVVADGVSVSLAARIFRIPLPGRVPGIDLMTKLLEIARNEKIRCFFLGAQESVVKNLCAALAERYPGLPIAGYHHGNFDRAGTEEIVRLIQKSSAQFLFVALGLPEAEIWCHRNGRATGAAVTMSVGGSFDVLSGTIRRSPHWMQRFGLEWLWRFALEPRKRFRVIFVDNAAFLGMVARQYWRSIRTRHA